MKRVPLDESSGVVREHLERNKRNGGGGISTDALLDTENGAADRIGMVLYILEGNGYVVVPSDDFAKAQNLRAALEDFLPRCNQGEE